MVFAAHHSTPSGVPDLNEVTTVETYTVEPRDTLWGIVAQRYPNQHTGQLVYLVRQINGKGNKLMDPDIHPGQVIDLPEIEVEDMED